MAETQIQKEQQPKIVDIVAGLDQQLNKKNEGHKKEQRIKLTDAWRYREEVRQKYDLPECGGRWEDPVGFISKIVDIIKKRGINLRYKHEFSKFFSKFPTAAAVNLDGNLVVTNSAENDWYGLRAQANQLAHEIVHALQDLRYPRMPEEEAEREAYYYQMLTPQQIIKYMEDPEFLDHFVNVVIQDHIEQSCKTNKKI